MGWFKALAMAQKIAIAVIAGLLLLWAGWFVYDLLTSADKVKGRLGENQAEAGIASGGDATRTVGDQAETEAKRERDVATAKEKVDEAKDTAGAHDAGAEFLCNNFGICSNE